jgi:hypothetical protein
MISRLITYGLTLFLVIFAIGAGAFTVKSLTENPCSLPKTFSLGAIDPRFGVSEDTVALYAKNAAAAWNDAYATNTLLSYVPRGGDVTITFVYDERQRTTITNEKIKQTIESEKSALDDLKDTIDSLRLQYSSLAKTINTQTETYNSDLSRHNSEVKYWNSQGGASSETYLRLQREGAALETRRATINANVSRYNQLASRIREYAHDHNEVVTTLNTKITTLNESALGEFEEGTYDPNTATITIYEFASATALKRVLMHELGHALGLNHVKEKDSIMYSLNESSSLALSSADKEELASVCTQKSLTSLMEDIRIIRDGIFHLAISSWHDTAVQAQ